MGRDMAISEADNLWVGTMPGGLTAQRAGPARTHTAGTGQEQESTETERERASPREHGVLFPLGAQDGLCTRGCGPGLRGEGRIPIVVAAPSNVTCVGT